MFVTDRAEFIYKLIIVLELLLEVIRMAHTPSCLSPEFSLHLRWENHCVMTTVSTNCIFTDSLEVVSMQPINKPRRQCKSKTLN